MKKILCSIICVMMCMSVSAQVVKSQTRAIKMTDRTQAFIKPFCSLGYQFIVVTKDSSSSYASSGVAVVQVMEQSKQFTLKPVECKEDSE